MRRLLLACSCLLASILPAAGQTVSGRLFEDLDGNGRLDPGEPVLEGVPIGMFGTTAGGAPFDAATLTAADGTWSLAPGDGCYLIDLPPVPGWRQSPVRSDRFPETTPGFDHPVGRPRWGRFRNALDLLRSGALRYVSLGDSIAFNFNACTLPENFWYSRQVQARLECAVPGAAIILDEGAIKGEHTDDLLVEDLSEFNNVFRMIRPQGGEPPPGWITLSIVGNDLLDVDASGTPTQAQINTAVEEILDSRRNLQEVLSVLLSELPAADVGLNTLYDNLAYNCPSVATSQFHRTWVPILDRILRDLAWGQIRPVPVFEVAADFGQEGLDGTCSGFSGQICRDFFGLDRIHPKDSGYEVIREKVWEGAGGLILGSQDPLGRTQHADVDYGFLRRVRRLYPTAWEVRNGAAAADPAAALTDADGGAAAAIQLGAADEEFRLSGFPDWFDEIDIVRAVAGVRYRTTGTVADDFYRMEASVTGQFRPSPGFAYTPTNWNFYTPLVGGGGPNQPAATPDYPDAALLVLPDVVAFREASSTLTKNPVQLPGEDEYDWPRVTADDLATTTIRVVSAPVAATAGNDLYTVELDAAWLDLYGRELPRPPEAGNVLVGETADGGLEVSFDPVAGADRYNLYIGRLGALRTGYDHGPIAPAGPFCAIATEVIGGGRLRAILPPASIPSIDSYLLVTAHSDDVESPSGRDSAGNEIDRSQSSCR